MTRKEIQNFSYSTLIELMRTKKSLKSAFEMQGYNYDYSLMKNLALNGNLNGKSKAVLLSVYRKYVEKNDVTKAEFDKLLADSKIVFKKTKKLNGFSNTPVRPSFENIKGYVENLEKQINDAEELLDSLKIPNRVPVYDNSTITGKLTLKGRIELMISKYKIK